MLDYHSEKESYAYIMLSGHKDIIGLGGRSANNRNNLDQGVLESDEKRVLTALNLMDATACCIS